MKRTCYFLVLAVAALVAAGCSPVSPYAAIVNGHVVSTSDLDDELHAITSNVRFADALDQALGGGQGTAGAGLHPGGANTVSSQFTSNVLMSEIQSALIDQDFKRLGLTITAADQQQGEAAARQSFGDPNDATVFDSLAANFKSEITNTQSQLAAIVRGQSSAGALRRYYDVYPRDGDKVCVQHILVNTLAQANDVRRQLLAGTDFTATAKANSDPNVQIALAQTGGDLGCTVLGQFELLGSSFHDALDKMVPGQISEPVKSKFGYHIILLKSRDVQTFDQASAQLGAWLGDKDSVTASLQSQAKIKVNPRYGAYTPDTQTFAAGTIMPNQPHVLSDPTPATDQSGSASGDLLQQDPGSAQSSPSPSSSPPQ